MNALSIRLFTLLSVTASATFVATQAQADPLPGRDLPKFVQLPMLSTPILDPNGIVTTYSGHDELSTAYGFINSAVIPSPNMMADHGRRFRRQLQ